ncbi:MAG: hypothetical protein Alis3KO_26330 [Aliiglaciecola sp.]
MIENKKSQTNQISKDIRESSIETLNGSKITLPIDLHPSIRITRASSMDEEYEQSFFHRLVDRFRRMFD